MKPEGYENLILETFGPVLRVTLNRPERRNALSSDLMAELLEVVSAAERDGDTSVLVLRGAGKSFCSGYDVSPDSSDDGDEAQAKTSPIAKAQSVRRDNRTFDLLWRLPIPTIAQIHGHCLAAGTDLAFSCDLVVCATDARIGYPAVRSMGVPATHMWLYHLGPQWTKRLLLTGDSITGIKAAEHGLALEAVEPEALDEHVLELATRMSWVTRDLLAANKHVINRGLDLMGRTLLQETAATQDVLGRLAPGADAFWKTAMSKGVKDAIAERDAPFAADDPIA
jgi:enoyl-CoA hydratase